MGISSSYRGSTLLGKTVVGLKISPDKTSLLFIFDDGTVQGVYAEGDCCSNSWIEHISGLKQIVGSPITSIEEVDMPQKFTTEEQDGHDVLEKYGCKISTKYGVMFLEYRNDSNGYYGGSLEFSNSYNVHTTTDVKEDF